MTVIAGLVHKGRVYMGGDSAAVGGLDLTVRKDPKVFHRGAFLLGFTYSFRMGQVLGHVFDPPAPPRRKADLHRFMVHDFVDSLRACLKVAGWSRVVNGQEEGGCFLVGVSGRLFTVEADYQVGEARDGYDAVGCGANVARGALYASGHMKPEPRVRTALRAAERHGAGVRGPFVVLSTEARR